MRKTTTAVVTAALTGFAAGVAARSLATRLWPSLEEWRYRAADSWSSWTEQRRQRSEQFTYGEFLTALATYGWPTQGAERLQRNPLAVCVYLDNGRAILVNAYLVPQAFQLVSYNSNVRGGVTIDDPRLLQPNLPYETFRQVSEELGYDTPKLGPQD